MSSENEPSGPPDEAALAHLMEATRCPFGPRFFLSQLAAFVRDRCPDPAEGLPQLELWLGVGGPITVCHIIALAPHWVAFAAGDGDGMRTEIVPYELIVRVTIGACPHGRGIGFDQAQRPLVLDNPAVSAEEALARAGRRTEST